MSDKKPEQIAAEMTVLDIVGQYPATEAVFHSYDEQAGECVCCQMLFESVQDAAQKYNLNLAELLTKLNAAVNE